tara:strand:- start:4670 stop:5503 length:834 start_codon:yes stop_codon:yes gene_type:complete
MNNFLKEYFIKIKEKKFYNPELELRVLLNNCSQKSKKEIFLSNFNICDIDIEKFKSAFNRRINHEPISKIFNKKEFWGLNFYVDQNVLDPRPESEFLIQAIKEFFPNNKSKLKICDLGTGSGCLAITLAKIYSQSNITAVDISHDAIKIAKINAKKHNLEKTINFINSDWILINNSFDLLVSNPPYLTQKEYENVEINIKKYEPKLALFGGLDGLNSYRQIAKKSIAILNKKSLIFLEIGSEQAEKIKKIFAEKNIKIIKIIKDYKGFDRVLVLQIF